MDKKLNPKDTVILCLVDENGKIKAVSGLEPDGKPKTVEPTPKNEADFLQFDKHGNVLENFIKNFLAQSKNPKHTGFYAFSMNTLERAGKFLENMIKVKPEDKALTPYKVDPQAVLDQKQGKEQAQQPPQRFQPIDLNKIDWKQVDNLNIQPQDLEGALKAMLWGHKSPNVVDIKIIAGGQEYPMQARLSLETKPDGTVQPVTYPKQEKPDFDKPFMGVTFTKEDIENLKNTGNGNRIFELEKTPGGEKVPSLVSLDPKTNRFEAIAAADVNIPKILKGVELSEEQQNGLAEGRAVWIEGMTQRARPGQEPKPGEEAKTIDRFVQFNASNKNFDFKFSPDQQQAHSEKRKQAAEQKQGSEVPKARKIDDKIWVYSKQGGVQLDKENFDKLCAKEPIFVNGMESQKPKQQTDASGAQKVEATDGKGQKYNAWVWIDENKGKVRHSSKHPDQVRAIEAKQAAKGQNVKPAAESKTQVAVNSEGKTNEATKHSKEPLAKGQTRPTEKQAEKKKEKQQEQKQSPAKPKKGKGMKM